MRQKVLHITAWIHSAMLLSLPILIVFIFLHKGNDTLAYTLYFKSLIILLPVAGTDIAVLKARNYHRYMLANILIFLISGMLGLALYLQIRPLTYAYIEIIIMLLEMLILFISRMQDRIKRNRYEIETENAAPGETEKPGQLLWNQPSYAALIVFILLYLIALNTASPSICNITFWGMIVYFFIAFIHHFIDTSEKYLFLNKDIYNLPIHRIYRISGIMTVILALALLIMCIPAIITSGDRHYRDIRDASFGSPVTYDELMMAENFNTSTQNISMDEILGNDTPPKPLPEWVNDIVYIFAGIIFIAVIILLIRQIRHALADFQRQPVENEDIIESLDDKDRLQSIRRSGRSHDQSYQAQIRRKYRRKIRKHRKDTPYPSEAPNEIEYAAGLSNDSEMQQLHTIYEQVRYGQDSEKIK